MEQYSVRGWLKAEKEMAHLNWRGDRREHVIGRSQDDPPMAHNFWNPVVINPHFCKVSDEESLFPMIQVFLNKPHVTMSVSLYQ